MRRTADLRLCTGRYPASDLERMSAARASELPVPTQSGHLFGEMERLEAVTQRYSRGCDTSTAIRHINSSGDTTMGAAPSREAVLRIGKTSPAALRQRAAGGPDESRRACRCCVGLRVLSVRALGPGNFGRTLCAMVAAHGRCDAIADQHQDCCHAPVRAPSSHSWGCTGTAGARQHTEHLCGRPHLAWQASQAAHPAFAGGCLACG
jgi:hypothetical protein